MSTETFEGEALDPLHSLPPLDDDLVLEEELGRGAGGRVVAATQRSLGRRVAVKLHAGLDHETARGFAREARVMARVAHPGIVPVLLHGTLGGRPALVMEHIDGTALDAVLDALRERSGAKAPALPTSSELRATLGGDAAPERGAGEPWWRVCARGVRDLARALDHAHRCGVLHRDVKPSNVLLDRSGRVLLADFGVAADDGDEGADAAGSLSGQAPELLRGGAATRASDVYALGAVLSEWASLEPPYAATGAAALVRAVDRGERRALPRRLPSGLTAIRERAMAQRPEDRYSSAADLARDLDALLEGRALLAARERPWARWARGIARHRRAAVAAGLVALVMGGAGSALQLQRIAAAERVRAASAGARGHLELAVATLSDVLFDAAAGSLQGQPLLDRKRKDLLVAGRSGTRDLLRGLREDEDDLLRTLRRVDAEATIALAEIERRLGAFEAGAAELEAAARAVDGLAPEDRAALEPRVEYVRFVLATDRGEHPADRARAALDAIDARVVEGGTWFLRASAWSGLAEASLVEGDVDAAVASSRAGVDEFEAALAEATRAYGARSATERLAQRELARIVGTHAAALMEADRLDAAETAALRSIELVEAMPPTVAGRSIDAISHDNLAGIQNRRGDSQGACEATRRALVFHRLATEAFPDRTDLAFGLARSARRYADQLRGAGAPVDERAAALATAESVLRAALARDASSPNLQGLLALVLDDRAQEAMRSRDWTAAHLAYEAALAEATRAHGLGAHEWGRDALAALWGRRMPLYFSNRPAEAAREVESYVAAFPEDPAVAWDAGALLASLARRRTREKAGVDELRALGKRSLELMERAVDLGLTGRRAAMTDSRIRHLVRVPSVARLLARIPE
ncbi:MAG: serine/threonine-protein kinase [Planctomycetota bacterium]